MMMAFIQSLSVYYIHFIVAGLVLAVAGGIFSRKRKHKALYVVFSIVFFVGIILTLAGVFFALQRYGVF